jgi:hypothetical protein
VSKRVIHIVFPAGSAPPLHATTNASTAYTIASSMLGVDVVTLPIEDMVPEVVRDDLEQDFDENDDTPQVAVVGMDDIDEG